MTADDVFRLIVMAGFCLVFPAALFYRIRSQATGEKLDRTQEGWFILLTLRPVAVVVIGCLIAWVIHPAWMAWSSLPFPVWLRGAGVAVAAAGGVSLIWVMRTLGANLTDTVVTRKNATLVTHGPYRYVRHPFYGAYLLSVLGNFLVIANWFFGLCALIVYILLVVRTRIEEEKLIARFGQQYKQYMARTGRFFPAMTKKFIPSDQSD